MSGYEYASEHVAVHNDRLPRATETDNNNLRAPLLATGTANEIRYAIAENVIEVDSMDKNYKVTGYPPIVNIVQPERVRYEFPGAQAISEIKSNEIRRNMLNGDHDGKMINRQEIAGAAISNVEGTRISIAQKKAMTSLYVDDYEQSYRQPNGVDIDRLQRPLTNSEKIEAKVTYSGYGENNLPTQFQETDEPSGYKMSEYTSEYDNPSGYKTSEESYGYQMNNYEIAYEKGDNYVIDKSKYN